MGLRYYVSAVLFLLITVSQSASAAADSISFSKNVRQGGTTFNITSRAAQGCTAQIVTVTLQRGGRNIAALKADIDGRVISAQAVELTGDGTPELVMLSRAGGGAVAELLDVYWLDGKTLRRSTIPDLDEQNGYRGGDRFHLEGRLMVRAVPVYRDGDSDGKPTGGTRSLKYEFKEGAFALYVQTENAANSYSNAAIEAAIQPVSVPQAENKPAVPAAVGPVVTEVSASEAGIEIRTNGAVAKYRTIRLDNPERIAIDIPGADSSLAGRKIAVNRFGISKARIGRNKGFIRVVLDTTFKKFPRYEVKSSASGILVEFPQ